MSLECVGGCYPGASCLEDFECEGFHDIDVGTSFTAHYTFDSDAVDTNPLTYVGDYWYTDSPSGIRIEVGNRVYETDPAAVDFLIEVVNDHPGAGGRDNYLLRSYNNMIADHISWQLDDASGTALSSTNLPTVPLDLSDWTQVFGLTISGVCGEEILRGTVETMTLQPEAVPSLSPTAVALLGGLVFGIALAGLAVERTRGLQ